MVIRGACVLRNTCSTLLFTVRCIPGQCYIWGHPETDQTGPVVLLPRLTLWKDCRWPMDALCTFVWLCVIYYTLAYILSCFILTLPLWKKRGIVSIFMDEDNEFRAALKPSVSGTAVQFQSFCPQAQCVPCLLCTENWNHLRSTIWFSKFTVD